MLVFCVSRKPLRWLIYNAKKLGKAEKVLLQASLYVCVEGERWGIFCFSVITTTTVFSLRSLSPSPLCPLVHISNPCFTASQAWRPLGVGFCDGNHGPRQSLCLQRSRQGGRPGERSWGTDLSCAGDNRDHPQSTGGHICLHLHIRHLKERLQFFFSPHSTPTVCWEDQ